MSYQFTNQIRTISSAACPDEPMMEVLLPLGTMRVLFVIFLIAAALLAIYRYHH